MISPFEELLNKAGILVIVPPEGCVDASALKVEDVRKVVPIDDNLAVVQFVLHQNLMQVFMDVG